MPAIATSAASLGGKGLAQLPVVPHTRIRQNLARRALALKRLGPELAEVGRLDHALLDRRVSTVRVRLRKGGQEGSSILGAELAEFTTPCQAGRVVVRPS